MPTPKVSLISLSKAERNDLFIRCAEDMSISPILVEKDFWVCWLLNLIFSSPYSSILTFKGGTSLSKCYGLISRFSEDIDLTIDRRELMLEKDENELTNKDFKRYLVELEFLAFQFLDNYFKPELERSISSILQSDGWELRFEDDDSINLRFIYPNSLNVTGYNYIKPSVLLEFGIKGETQPQENKRVISYVEVHYSDLLKHGAASVRTLNPVRTFWEKATILHAEFYRPEDKAIGDRLSRHYYDLYMMLKSGIGTQALEEVNLLEEVSNHKKRFFRAAWASYETAVPGTLRLTPNSVLLKLLERDYAQMKEMIFGKSVPFTEILAEIKEFEGLVNNLPS